MGSPTDYTWPLKNVGVGRLLLPLVFSGFYGVFEGGYTFEEMTFDKKRGGYENKNYDKSIILMFSYLICQR